MSSFIPLQQAATMTALYRAQKENILDPAYRNKNILSICETFNRADIDAILAEPDCVSLRIYYGMDEALNVHAIIVGANSQDQDILPVAGRGDAAPGDDGGRIDEDGYRCPPHCPPPSPLNGG